MLPVIALVGRPNVGKSTLFNVLTQSRAALVADFPGVTRDRQYGRGEYDDQQFVVIDTGGIADEHQVDALIAEQVAQALHEADILIFVVDGRQGLTAGDEIIAQMLREQQKPVVVVVNKIDGLDEHVAQADFYTLGFESVIPVAASHRHGTSQIMVEAIAKMPAEVKAEAVNQVADIRQGITFAIVGRPNVGKSTLTNRILGENRVLALDAPGTTTDSVYIPFERHGQAYTIVDTAGVRRRSKVTGLVEKFSVVKTLNAIEKADVVLVLIDAREDLTEQDLHLIGYCLQAGRSLVLAVNKWDGLSSDQRQKLKDSIERRLSFVADFVPMFFISAEHGTAVGELFPAIQAAYQSAKFHASSAELTKVLEDAVFEHAPPLIKGRRAKLRYAHMGGQVPPVIVIHGTQATSLPADYQRYLMNQFRKVYKLVSTPIRLELKSPENPFADKKNTLTKRQIVKKRRLMKFVKKNARK